MTKYSIILIVLFLFGCQTKIKDPVKPIIIKGARHEQIRPYANPCIIYGVSFGNFFQSLYRMNKYDLMLAFTSNRTIKQFKNEQVLQYYKHLFKFDYKLGLLSNSSNDNGVTILTYSKACIYGTRRKVMIGCIIENDSVKIILQSLSNKQFE